MHKVKVLASIVLLTSGFHCSAMQPAPVTQLPMVAKIPAPPDPSQLRPFIHSCHRQLPQATTRTVWARAIEKNDIEGVKKYFDSWISYFDVRRRSKIASALELAAQQPHTKTASLIDYLLGQVNPDYIDARCLIKLAAKNGHVNFMKYIMKTYEIGDGLAAWQLRESIIHSNPQKVKTCLDAGVDPVANDAMNHVIWAFTPGDDEAVLNKKMYILRHVAAKIPEDKRSDMCIETNRCNLHKSMQQRIITALSQFDIPTRLCMEDVPRHTEFGNKVGLAMLCGTTACVGCLLACDCQAKEKRE